MKKDKLIITLVAVAAAVVVVLALVFAPMLSSSGSDYTSSLKKGQEYYASGDYDKAIIAYKTAIEKNGSGIEAYEGLAQAYMASGYLSLANSTIQTGLAVSASPLLEQMKQELAQELGTDEKVPDDTAQTAEKKADPTLNESLLKFIAGATYTDYAKNYELEEVQSQEGSRTYRVKDLDLEISFDNVEGNAPYSNAMPDRARLLNITKLFDVSGDIYYTSLAVISNIHNLVNEDDSVTFDAYGCTIRLYTDENGKILPEALNYIVISDKKDTEEGEEETEEGKSVCILSGTVKDAATGEPIEEADVRAYKGYSNTGEPVEGTTDSSGSYELAVTGGNDYYIEVEKDGYITGTFSAYVLSANPTQHQDFTISQELEDDVIRIVLTWDSSPRDLDSYLRGNTDSGMSFQTSYFNQKAADGSGNTIAELDLDDTDGYGPETTTVYDMAGIYTFRVVDFNVTGTMASSGATVNVYKGSALMESIAVSSSVVDVWEVCTIDHGNITVLNRAGAANFRSDIK